MKCMSLFMVGALIGGAVPAASAQGLAPNAWKAGTEKAVNLCSACHGPRGISTSPEFPTLAGQHEPYLIAQMKAFRDRTRAEKEAHDFMWGIAAQLDEATIAGIARYYSVQLPAPGRPVDLASAMKGRALFARGSPERAIPACATCHGQDAEGSAERPRLAGQHAKYIAKQLSYMQTLERETQVMREVVKDLTPEEKQAVAAYVESLSSIAGSRVGPTTSASDWLTTTKEPRVLLPKRHDVLLQGG